MSLNRGIPQSLIELQEQIKFERRECLEELMNVPITDLSKRMLSGQLTESEANNIISIIEYSMINESLRRIYPDAPTDF